MVGRIFLFFFEGLAVRSWGLCAVLAMCIACHLYPREERPAVEKNVVPPAKTAPKAAPRQDFRQQWLNLPKPKIFRA